MITYSQYRPTACDIPGLGLKDRQGWLVAPCGTNRDAGVLQRSNWNAQARMLNDVDPEGLDHEAHSFGHWACGHFDIVLVRPGSDCAKEAERIQDALAEYPVLDEADWSNAEHQEICEFWQHESLKSRVLLCSEAGVSIFAARREAPPDKVYESLRDEVL